MAGGAQNRLPRGLGKRTDPAKGARWGKNLWAGLGTAIDRYLPWTHTLTVHWALAGSRLPGDTPYARRKALFELARHWLKARGVSWTILWVEERSWTGKDVHFHALLSLPNRRLPGTGIRLPKAFEAYLRSLLGSDPWVLKFERAHNPQGWLRYMLKAAENPDGLKRKKGEPPQYLTGAGTSRNINAKVRRELAGKT